MEVSAKLHDLLGNSAKAHPDATAVIDPDRASILYRELDRDVGELARRLQAQGVGPGDRVGLLLPKSIGSIVSLYAILKAGAAYVPVDYGSPVARNRFIFSDCGVRALVVATDRKQALLDDWEFAGAVQETPLDFLAGYGISLTLLSFPAPECEDEQHPADLAYILYTSGSTGQPKGVMHTHASALAFIHWCDRTFDLSPADRFSSHAPLHFDLSIFDVFVSVMQGATLVLIGEAAGKQPQQLSRLIESQEISIWYSTPSILRLMVEFGKLDQTRTDSLRMVFFAGEVYPVSQFRKLHALVPNARYYNFYGPTETNVCTWYAVPEDPSEVADDHFPIGRVCSDDAALIVDGDCQPVGKEDKGELLIRGGSVMAGYWALPERNADAFVTIGGARWYRTGDIVQEVAGDIVYLGRRDRMVKRRGYRVELGEIESALYHHDGIVEAAAVAIPDDDNGVLVNAFVSARGEPLSLIELKTFSASALPNYMIPDRFHVLDSLPKTSTDKIDYQKLKELI